MTYTGLGLCRPEWGRPPAQTTVEAAWVAYKDAERAIRRDVALVDPERVKVVRVRIDVEVEDAPVPAQLDLLEGVQS